MKGVLSRHEKISVDIFLVNLKFWLIPPASPLCPHGSLSNLISFQFLILRMISWMKEFTSLKRSLTRIRRTCCLLVECDKNFSGSVNQNDQNYLVYPTRKRKQKKYVNESKLFVIGSNDMRRDLKIYLTYQSEETAEINTKGKYFFFIPGK